jgi:hypothetical protein
MGKLEVLFMNVYLSVLFIKKGDKLSALLHEWRRRSNLNISVVTHPLGLLKKKYHNPSIRCPVALVHVFEQLIRVNPLMGKADRNESYLIEHILPLVSKQC